MGEVVIQGSHLGNHLSELLTAQDIVPGDQPSYELCKTLWLYHPLGQKMVEGPIGMAQSQPREITIQDGPEDMCKEAFQEQWEKDRCDEVIYNVCSVARAYGIGTLGLQCEEVAPDKPVPPAKLADLQLSFPVWDSLNTAGSLVLNQNPNSIDFMKVMGVSVAGVPMHRSRTVTLMNERPVYIAYTSSAYGFVGRSVFQRALFPMKSFVQSMVTDDLVTKKAGVFIATLKSAGSIIDAVMQAAAGLKRFFVQVSTNGNVISIGPDEKIETLNMQNIDGAFGMARKDILENIATAAGMPAIVLKQETFAEGFGEGTEDAKMVAGFVSAYRRQITPVYHFMDPIIRRRAWNPEFYARVQNVYKQYRGVEYEVAVRSWENSFKAQWPNYITEPDSEKAKNDKVKLDAIISIVETFGPMLDPENKARLIETAYANVNTNEFMFQEPFELDIDELREYEPPTPMGAMQGEGGEDGEAEGGQAKGDSTGTAVRRMMRRMSDDDLENLISVVAANPEWLDKIRGDAQIIDFPQDKNVTTDVTRDVTRRQPKRDRAAYMRARRLRERQERERMGGRA